MENSFKKDFEKSKRKEKRRKLVLLAILIVFGLITLFRGYIGEMYKKATSEEIEVSLVINCYNLWKDNKVSLEKKEKEHLIPEKGEILKKETFKVKKGETAFDLLKKVTLEKKIHTDYKFVKAYNNYYVKAINNLYEFDGGKESGWQYYVNKEYMNYGSSSYKLKDKDAIYWVYTCNGGKDIDFNEI